MKYKIEKYSFFREIIKITILSDDDYSLFVVYAKKYIDNNKNIKYYIADTAYNERSRRCMHFLIESNLMHKIPENRKCFDQVYELNKHVLLEML